VRPLRSEVDDHLPDLADLLRERLAQCDECVIVALQNLGRGASERERERTEGSLVLLLPDRTRAQHPGGFLLEHRLDEAAAARSRLPRDEQECRLAAPGTGQRHAEALSLHGAPVQRARDARTHEIRAAELELRDLAALAQRRETALQIDRETA
jgi:hypothetical protein